MPWLFPSSLWERYNFKMELLRLLSTNEVVAQAVSFLILLFILRIFAWKKILALLDARKQKIASEFDRIEKAKQESARLKTEYDEKLARIEELARIRIQEAVNESRHIAQDIKQKAQEDARLILKKSQENIELELVKVKEELKDKIIDLSLTAAGHIIKEKLTVEKDGKLISEFLDDLEKLK